MNTKGGNGQTISNTYYYYAESVNNSTQSTALTAAQVTDGTLLGYLKTNKMTITGALNWAANTEGYPAPTTVVEVPVDVVVSWTAPENGTLVITKTDSTQVSNPETLPSGTVLTVKATPDTGYILKELTVNGTPVTVTGGIFYLELPREESVTIVAQFQEIRYLWTDPEVVGTAFAGGDGQAATPYEIADGAQLAYLATLSDTENKYYKLTADIDLSAHQWVPIKGFAGHFDGDGHTVKGLTVVNEEGVSDIGLFGTILGGSSVKNVVLKNVKIDTAVAADTGRISAGALVGRIDIITKAGEVDIINCMVLGNSSICVTANHSKWELLGLGGIVGTAVPNNSSGASTVRIINCFNAADLTATENGGNLQVELGGIVGAAYCDDAITGVNYYLVNCGNTGDLTANSTTTKEIGGIAGRFRTKAANSISVVNNCYNTGVITGASRLCPIVFTHAGGTEQSIENVYYCVADGSEVTDTTGAEKLTAQQATDGTLLDKLNLQTAKLGTLGYDGVHQWAAGQDTLPAPTGEKIIVRDVKVSVSNTTEKLGTVRVEINGKEVTTWPQTVKSGTVLTIIGTPVKGYKVSGITVNGKPVENVANTTNVTVTEDVNTVKVKFDKIRFWTDDGAFASAFAGGLGTQEEPYQIADGAQLAYMAKEMQAGKNFADTHFQLTDNIDLSKYEWVTMLCINKNAQGNVVYQAFAGHFDGNGKTVTGLRIDTQANPSKLPHAGLFGIVSGSVKNLTVQGKINVKDTGVSFGGVGLIAGYLQGGTVTDCSAKGTVTAVRTQAYVGGIAGIAEAGSSIINCVNYASISAGHTGKDLTDANGNPIVATGRIGGIAGYVIAGGAAKAGVVVANCANIGSVTATAGNMNEVAGIAGRVENNPNNGQTISIFNCYNAGKITGGKNTKETLLGNILARKAQDGKLENDFLYAASELKDPSVVIVNVQSNMKSKTFAATLSKNTASLASNGIAGLRKWNTVTDGCPVPTGKSVKVPDFQVSKPKVTGGKVEILMDGQKVTSFPLTVKGGTVLTIICTPSSGNILRDVSINDEAIVNPVSPVVVKITSDSTIKVKFGPPEYWNEEGIAAADYAGGDGSWSNPYQIYNGAQLGYIAKQSLEGETFAGKYFVLTDNIDLSAYKWTPIKEFAGYFNGRGYTVYGIRRPEFFISRLRIHPISWVCTATVWLNTFIGANGWKT